jgi:hypothetical protein
VRRIPTANQIGAFFRDDGRVRATNLGRLRRPVLPVAGLIAAKAGVLSSFGTAHSQKLMQKIHSLTDN